MSNFAIMADATCDLTKELSEKYDIITVPGHLVFPGNKEIKAFLDWETVPRDEFYADLKKKPDEYSTSPANVEEFAEAMGKPASEGKDIILMTISAGMSGAYNFALQAKDIVEKKYGVNIKIIDSMRFGPGFGLMAIHASLQRAQGKSMEEVAAWIEENKAVPIWSEEMGQNVVEFKKDNSVFQCWLEDEQSLILKLQTMKDNRLAGGAFWKNGQDKNSIWDIIITYMR